MQVHKYFLTDWALEKAKKRNVKVTLWDVRDKDTMVRMIDKGVGFIESDNPDYAGLPIRSYELVQMASDYHKYIKGKAKEKGD